MGRYSMTMQLLRPHFPAYQFGQPTAGHEQSIDHAFVQMTIGCGHQPAAFGGVQHFRHGEHADGCAFHAGHGPFAARRQGGFRPEQAIRTVAVADAFEASPEGAQVGCGIVAIVVAAVAGG